AAGVWITGGPVYSGPPYDAVLHAVFLGFVISMIMAHAPTILPAVLRRPLPYRPVMYVPVVLLHASLLVRTAWGDARGDIAMVQWGGVVNIVALLLFVLIAVVSVVVGVPKRAPRPRSSAAQNVARPHDAESALHPQKPEGARKTAGMW
ncbi:MAG TPA: hypothetical protein VIR33_13005, partial [Thermopolyspora sp.]